jgi:hypothetical protein
MRKFAIMAMLALLPPVLSAARLMLRDGTVVRGNFVSGTQQSIVFQDESGARRRFDLNQVQSIDFGEPVTALDRGRNSADRGPGRFDEPRYQHDWTVLPAGTSLSVRTDETIDSNNAAEGRTFPAAIVQDVLDANGNVVIPRGSRATLVVRRVTEGGTVTSGSYILDLDAVHVNGRRYVVNTSDVAAGENGIGKNKRTAEYVGGGAVLGTLLGAIAGGGKGAAIGAAAGAAAGGGAEVLTKGHQIRVPAETVLNFRLERSLHLREAQ